MELQCLGILLLHNEYGTRLRRLPSEALLIKAMIQKERVEVQTTPFNSYPNNSDLCLFRIYLRPPLRDNQNNIIQLIRISLYS